jgi:4-amino-4-deoxy-L-arabinose transferase-like glycosyltransferase
VYPRLRERGMPPMNASTVFWSAWALLLVAKLWLACALPLFGDEAFYWLESRALAPAHDDVPGMTPWLIAAGTSMVGDTRLGVRLPFLAIAAFTAWFLMASARAAFGAQAGAWAGVIAMLLPLFAINGVLALPDVPLTLAILCCAEALRRLCASDGRHGHWLLAVGLALGCLSHYRFVLALGAGGLWLLLDPQGRQLLRLPGVWVAGGAGIAVGLAPLLWQQWRQGGQGFVFQFAERHPWQFQREGLLDPLLQAVVVTPGLFVLLVLAAVTAWRRRDDAGIRVFLGIGAILLAGLMLVAPFADTDRSRLHWSLPGWLLLAMLLPTIAQQWRGRWPRAALLAACGIAALGVTGAVGYLGLVAHAPHRLAATALYPPNFTGWTQVAGRVADALDRAPADTLLAADNFMLAAQLSFELGGRTVFSLDHPLNRKHGRQGELSRRGLDQAALLRAASTHPVLLVVDEGASRLRDRPAWLRQACEALPRAEAIFDVAFDHHRRRFAGMLQLPDAGGACAPPPLAYLHQPAFGARIQGELTVRGWALRDRVGIARLWLLIDGERVAVIDHRRPDPGVQTLFPGSDDPHHPEVGFLLTLPAPALQPGRHWLAIEAESEAGLRSVLASVPFDWKP